MEVETANAMITTEIGMGAHTLLRRDKYLVSSLEFTLALALHDKQTWLSTISGARAAWKAKQEAPPNYDGERQRMTDWLAGGTPTSTNVTTTNSSNANNEDNTGRPERRPTQLLQDAARQAGSTPAANPAIPNRTSQQQKTQTSNTGRPPRQPPKSKNNKKAKKGKNTQKKQQKYKQKPRSILARRQLANGRHT